MTGQQRRREQRSCVAELSVMILFTESDAFDLVRRVIGVSHEVIETDVLQGRELGLSVYPDVVILTLCENLKQEK